MAKKAKITRKEIKQPDQFITTSARIIEYVTEHRNQIVTGVALVVALVLIIAGWRYHKRYSENKAVAFVGEGLVLFHEAEAEDDGGELSEELEAKYRAAADNLKNAALDYSSTNAAIQANLYLGQIHFRIGEFDEAIERFQAVIDGKQGEGEQIAIALDGAGYCHEFKGEHALAADVFRRIVHMERSHLKEAAYLNAARNFRLMGDEERAIDLYESMLEHFDGSPNSAIVKTHLQILKERVGPRQEDLGAEAKEGS